jgi:hypothetical protein
MTPDELKAAQDKAIGDAPDRDMPPVPGLADDADNPAYRLGKRLDHAREVADTSTNPGDHAHRDALQAVVDAEVYTLERQVHDVIHGVPDPADFESWSQVSQPGTYSWPGEFEGPIEIDPRLDPNA